MRSRKAEKEKRNSLAGIPAVLTIGFMEFLEAFLLYRKVRGGRVIHALSGT